MLWMGENKNIYTQPTQGCSTTFSILIRNCNWIFFVSCSLLSSSFPRPPASIGKKKFSHWANFLLFSLLQLLGFSLPTYLYNVRCERFSTLFLSASSSLCAHEFSEWNWKRRKLKIFLTADIELELLLDDDDCEICTLRKKATRKISLPNFSTRWLDRARNLFSVYIIVQRKKRAEFDIERHRQWLRCFSHHHSSLSPTPVEFQMQKILHYFWQPEKKCTLCSDIHSRSRTKHLTTDIRPLDGRRNFFANVFALQKLHISHHRPSLSPGPDSN